MIQNSYYMGQVTLEEAQDMFNQHVAEECVNILKASEYKVCYAVSETSDKPFTGLGGAV